MQDDSLTGLIERELTRKAIADTKRSIGVNAVLWIILYAIGLSIVAYQGMILTFIWDWFAVPNGFQPLSFAQAMGVLIVVTFVAHNPLSKSKDDDGDEPAHYKAIMNLCMIFAWATLAWASAALWHFIIL